MDLHGCAGYHVLQANFFILHTSASLTINENASPDVPLDLNDALDRIAPEGSYYRYVLTVLTLCCTPHLKARLQGCMPNAYSSTPQLGFFQGGPWRAGIGDHRHARDYHTGQL